MSIATRSEGHRLGDAHAAWLPVPHLPRAAPGGRHRRGAARATHDGSVEVLRRAISAAAVWAVGFGLFSLARGWMRFGSLALLVSGLLVLGVVASCALGADAVTGREAAGPAGVKSRGNGYRHKT